MKAWKISSDDHEEGVCEIVFADTRAKAKSIGKHSDHFCDIDYHRIDAHRAPAFDGRESNPPTLRELVMEHGWEVVCENCGFRAGEDNRPVWSGDRIIECDECDNP